MNSRSLSVILMIIMLSDVSFVFGSDPGQAIKLKEPPSDIKEISRVIMPESIEYPIVNKDNKECHDWKDDVQSAIGLNKDRILQYSVPEFNIDNKDEFYIWSDDKEIRDRITEWTITGAWDGLDLGLNFTGKVRLCLGGRAYDKENKDSPLVIDRYKSLYLWSYKIKSEKPLPFRTVNNYISWYPPYSSCTNARVVNYGGRSLFGTLTIIMACDEAYKKIDDNKYYMLFFGTDGQMGACRSN